MDGVHLQIGDVVLPAGLICLGGSEDHEAAIDLRELGIFLLGAVD